MPDAPVPSSGPTPGPFPEASGPFPDPASRGPRGRFLADLAASMVQALDDGDVAAARVAHEAIGRLLSSMAANGEGGTVVDLQARRDHDARTRPLEGKRRLDP